MGIFDFLAGKGEKSWEEKDAYTGETPDCPNCGTPLTKKYVYSGMCCLNCRYGLEDDVEPDDSEMISVYDAALIWMSNGQDEDYTFGYSEQELREALQ